MNRSVTKLACTTAILTVALLALASSSAAQSPVITSAPTLVPAGPDYATDVLGNPWDFSDPLDVGPFPDELGGWTITGTLARTIGRAAFLSGGHFVGRTSGDGQSTVPLLFRGGADIVNPENENIGAFDHKAIPTGRYGKLAVRATLSGTPGGQMTAYWYATPYGSAHHAARGVVFRVPEAGTHIYLVDLETGIWTDARGNPVQGPFVPVGDLGPIAWSGTPLMRGLQLRPVTSNAVVDVQIDWVRLTQRDGLGGAATMPVSFAGCPGREYNVEVMSSANSWDVIHTGRAGSSSVTTAIVNHGVLPPGAWAFRVGCFPVSRGPGGGTPVYSQPFGVTINAPPVVDVLNPDALGGADYASTVRGNAWDWNSLSDAAQLYEMTPAIVSEAGGNALQGTATASGDPAVVFVYGQSIDTTRFRHLTFTLTLDTPFELAPPGGSVARVFFEAATSSGSALSMTQDILVWPGRNQYTMDLGSLTTANGALDPACGCANLPWGSAAVRYFRIDPHESARGVTFRLGPVFLTAHDEVPIGGQFPIQYRISDADVAGSSYEARIYLDTDRDPGARSLIDVVPNVTPNATLQYHFDPAGRGVPPGDYLVYIEVVESRAGFTQTHGMYSSGPLRVLTGVVGPTPPGPPSLVATQTAANPVTIAWSPGPGGTPTSYTIVAGTSPGASNLAVVNVGLQTQITGHVPPGLPIYVRVVASNAVGSAVSNEISFALAGPSPPPPPAMGSAMVSGQTVGLSWAASPGPPPLYYVIVVRVPGHPDPILAHPVAQTSLVVHPVPRGTYVVSVVAVNGVGPSSESGSVIVTVQ